MSLNTSIVASSLQNVLGVLTTRIPVNGITLVSYVLPPVVGYLAVALLVVTPQTRTIRVALWPVVALLALRAALSVDMSFGQTEHKVNNANFVLFMLAVAARTLDWTLAKGPLVRHLRPANGTPSAIMDALDLACNFRGHGWDWSRYETYTPRETRPAGRTAFIFRALRSAATQALLCGVFHRAVKTWTPVGIIGLAPNGSTIFDETLSFPVQYFRATVISALTALWLYAVMQMGYDLCSVPAVLVLGQDPAQWPPLFDAPWRSTSLNALWGRRWHQLFRHVFHVLGGRPLSLLFGRAGAIVGTFLASALWHHVRLRALDDRADYWWTLVGFGMMSPGLLAERAYYKWTGRRVGGVLGWFWTMTWFLVWGNLIVEGFARAGMFASSNPLDSALGPIGSSVEHLMIRFDQGLHAISRGIEARSWQLF